MTAYSSLTLFGIHSLGDKLAGAIVGGEVKWGMRPGVDLVHIDTAHQETLEDFVSATSRSLVNRCVTVHVNFSWRKILLKENPNYFEMAVITSPMERSILARLRGVLWLSESILFLFFGLAFFLASVCLLVQVWGVSTEFN